jgi:hypothetical protein
MAAPLIANNFVPIVPGIYFQMAPSAEANLPVTGVVAVVGAADDGPINVPTTILTIDRLSQLFASGAAYKVAAEALRGGALQVLFNRAGSSAGVVATKTLVDTTGTPVNAVRVDWLYPGTRGNLGTLTVADSIDAPSTFRVASLYINAILVESFRFAKGSSGIGEPQALVNAIVGNSAYITATKLADGNKILATVSSPVALISGANPTVDAAAYVTAEGALEAFPWNVAVFDTQDTSVIQPSIVTWAKTLESKGLYRLVVLGDPPSVTPTAATRYGRAAAYNYWNLAYVIDSYVRTNFDATVTTVEGAEAAGRVAGLLAAGDIDLTLSGMLLGNDVKALSATPISASDVASAIISGAIAFNYDDAKRPQVASGVSTYVTLDGIHSKRWKNLLRVARRYRIMVLISSAWQHLQVENDANGQGTVIAKANEQIATMVKGHYFTGGTVAVSQTPSPPLDDLAYFALNLVDQGKIERLVGIFQFP